MKKLTLLLWTLFVLTISANSQIVVKEPCHNPTLNITADSVFIQIGIYGSIDICESNIPHIKIWANPLYNMTEKTYCRNKNCAVIMFDEIPNLYEYDSEDTDYYVKFKAELLRINPAWDEKNIIILSE
jgi:hypothetical protein